ncbi:hypothetical protein Tco_0300603 [Tanacetum coccineum]
MNRTRDTTNAKASKYYEREFHERIECTQNKLSTSIQVKVLDASSGYTESSGTVSGKRNVSSSSGNDCSKIGNDNKLGNESSNSGKDTNFDGEDIRPSYDIEPMDEVSNTTDYNVFVVQPKFTNETYVMKKDDSNVSLDSSYMNPCEGTIGQHSRKHEDERVLLDSLMKN